MANPIRSFWNKFKANRFVQLLSAPFRWVGRQFKSIWERFQSKKPQTTQLPQRTQSENVPQSNVSTAIAPSRPLQTSQREKVISFIPDKVPGDIESYQERAIVDLVAFCAKHNEVQRANEIKNNLDESKIEKVIFLKDLSHEVLCDRIELLADQYESVESVNFKAEKVDPLINELYAKIKIDESPEDFIQKLKEADAAINELAAKMSSAASEKTVSSPEVMAIPTKAAAPSSILEPIVSPFANSVVKEKAEPLETSKELERLLKIKTAEYEKMTVSDTPSSYKAAMKDSNMVLALSPQGSFMDKISRSHSNFKHQMGGYSGATSEEISESVLEIQELIDASHKKQFISLQFEAQKEGKNYRDDLNSFIQNAYKAIDEARSLINKDDLSLKAYDEIIRSALYLEGIIDFTCNEPRYQKKNDPKNIHHGAQWQAVQESGIDANMTKLNNFIEAAKLSVPVKKSSLKG